MCAVRGTRTLPVSPAPVRTQRAGSGTARKGSASCAGPGVRLVPARTRAAGCSLAASLAPLAGLPASVRPRWRSAPPCSTCGSAARQCAARSPAAVVAAALVQLSPVWLCWTGFLVRRRCCGPGSGTRGERWKPRGSAVSSPASTPRGGAQASMFLFGLRDAGGLIRAVAPAIGRRVRRQRWRWQRQPGRRR